ncbi:MarR family winged helix-turn-helix transcriptional regulator [Streptomyces sp. YIM 98790]|uniref:MarR family winged helix-turn-helix transcriptional regulator n=1 Tax=Streptomyces sp. YIM 98790 TaxID=2689077 RepID=UPI00140C3596|nr:MarR family winged helix-turn-helix transcriptional regulator [Streptomyces sp. YIM 98790]
MTTVTPPARTVADVSWMLSHTSRVLATRMAAAFGELGITPRAFCVLFHAMEAERTQIQLAEIADLDKTTMVTTVDELERAGLAERQPSRTDRRARIIRVTPAGERAVAEGTRIADRVHGEVLQALEPGDREPFLRALTTLTGGLLAAPAESPAPVRRARRPRG